MAILRNSAEGGTPGTDATGGNSGGASGDAFSAITTNFAFSTAQAMHGVQSYSVNNSTTAGYARWAISGRKVALRFYVWLNGAATADAGLARISHATDTTALTPFLNGVSALRISNKGTSNAWTASSAFPLQQWVRVEIFADQGTTATGGSFRVAYYLGDSTTAVEDSGFITGQNLGGDLGALTQVRVGRMTNGYTQQTYWDDVAVNSDTDATAFIGPEVIPDPDPLRTATPSVMVPV